MNGIIAALRVPFDETGALQAEPLEEHLDWLKACGVTGVLVNGSTAEFPLLSVAQRIEAMETVAALAAPLPVLANVSDLRAGVLRQLAVAARRLNLAGVAIMPPAFYPTGAPDQIGWFELAASASGLPVVLYNFPELTGNRIDPGTIRSFAKGGAMAGIKQSGGEFAYHRELIELGGELGFRVFSGSDTRLPEVFMMGASGCIGGLVNFVPEWMVEQYGVFARGEAGSLQPTAERLQRVGELVKQASFPENVMAGMRARDLEPGHTQRLVSGQSQRRLQDLETALRALFKECGLPSAACVHASATWNT